MGHHSKSSCSSSSSSSSSSSCQRGKRGCRGKKGPKGDPGVQGPQGPTGLQGVDGLQGVQGAEGPVGDSPVGPTGPDGMVNGFSQFVGSGVFEDGALTDQLVSAGEPLTFETVPFADNMGTVATTGTFIPFTDSGTFFTLPNVGTYQVQFSVPIAGQLVDDVTAGFSVSVFSGPTIVSMIEVLTSLTGLNLELGEIAQLSGNAMITATFPNWQVSINASSGNNALVPMLVPLSMFSGATLNMVSSVVILQLA